VQQVYNSSVASVSELKSGQIPHDRPVRIQYNTKDSYKLTAKMLGLMDDFKVTENYIKKIAGTNFMFVFRVECLVLVTEALFPFSTMVGGCIWLQMQSGRNMTQHGASAQESNRTPFLTLTTHVAKSSWL